MPRGPQITHCAVQAPSNGSARHACVRAGRHGHPQLLPAAALPVRKTDRTAVCHGAAAAPDGAANLLCCGGAQYCTCCPLASIGALLGGWHATSQQPRTCNRATGDPVAWVPRWVGAGKHDAKGVVQAHALANNAALDIIKQVSTAVSLHSTFHPCCCVIQTAPGSDKNSAADTHAGTRGAGARNSLLGSMKRQFGAVSDDGGLVLLRAVGKPAGLHGDAALPTRRSPMDVDGSHYSSGSSDSSCSTEACVAGRRATFKRTCRSGAGASRLSANDVASFVQGGRHARRRMRAHRTGRSMHAGATCSPMHAAACMC